VRSLSAPRPEYRRIRLTCSLINLLSLLLLSLLPIILSPILASNPSASSRTKEIGMWYNLLLSWPVFATCFLINVSRCQISFSKSKEGGGTKRLMIGTMVSTYFQASSNAATPFLPTSTTHYFIFQYTTPEPIIMVDKSYCPPTPHHRLYIRLQASRSRPDPRPHPGNGIHVCD